MSSEKNSGARYHLECNSSTNLDYFEYFVFKRVIRGYKTLILILFANLLVTLHDITNRILAKLQEVVTDIQIPVAILI